MKKSKFPIVGIGASAGGLGAFKELLEVLPKNTGMSFVLIQHLDPNHESSLTEILEKTSSMQILEVKRNQKVKPNHIYVIPPKLDLTLVDYELIVNPRKISDGQHMPIDKFLKSLAKELEESAIGVILSGTGNDGSAGIQAIKNKGGITFAHEPKLAAYDQMPKNAIASGHIDFVLAPKEIALALFSLKNSLFLADHQIKRDQLHKIFEILKKNQHVDFSNYKEPTIKRRLFRRMVLNKMYSIDDYLHLLENNSEEIKNLYNDLLINVTEFFRDEEAFKVLKDEVFTTFLNKNKEDSIRIWIPGCSTGEEVYSIAITLLEFLKQKNKHFRIQIFASDISEKAINHARAGIYSSDQLKNVKKSRIENFFQKTENGYQISKTVRDICVFAIQNVTADPPFSKLDLISCRNLLIYLDKELQKKVIPLFHYALKPNGFLFLGISETINSFNDLFHEVNRKNKIYIKKSSDLQPSFTFPPHFQKKDIAMNDSKKQNTVQTESELRRDIERYLARHSVGVVINDKLEVIHSMGDVSAYLTLNSGTPSFNITKMAREFLALEINSLVHKAKETLTPVISELLELKSEYGNKKFFLEIAPLGRKDQNGKIFLVLFKEALFYNEDSLLEEASIETETSENKTERTLKLENQKLKQELNYTKETLLALKENLLTSLENQEVNNEKLLVANEEILSSNEELQSTNEELETAKEELQSTNEELTTVNQELQNRNEELSVINDDLINLLSSVNIPVIMIDRSHQIRRFTPMAKNILSIIPSDIGRKITDIKLKISVPDFKNKIDLVVNTESPQQIEVTDEDGHWYDFHIIPYRTADNKIDGAVLVLIDIHALKISEDFFKAIVETMRYPLLVLDHDFRISKTNPSFCETYQLTVDDTEGKIVFDLDNKQWNIPKLHELLTEKLSKTSFIKDYEVAHFFEKMGQRTMLFNAREIVLKDKSSRGLILLSIQDITDQRKKEKKLKDISERLIDANKELEQFACIASHDLQEPLRMVSLYIELLKDKAFNKLNKDELDYINTALKGTKKMKELITDLLALASTSIEGVKNDTVDVSKLISDITHTLDSLIKENNVIIEAKELPTILINENLLGEVFINLITNSIKYKGTRDPQIIISAKKLPHEWVFSVKDNGIGIKPENQIKIFKIFKRLHNSQEYPGTGIGLAMCNKIVKNYGGKIWVDSEFGKGSTFSFSIPDLEKNKSS